MLLNQWDYKMFVFVQAEFLHSNICSLAHSTPERLYLRV